MKKVMLFCGLVLAATLSKAQQMKYLVGANTGVFTLHGPSTEKVSSINAYSLSAEKGYTNNPFSSNLGGAYGVSAQVQRFTKGRLVFGAGLGYEFMQNNMEINQVYGPNGNMPVAAKGRSTVTYQFINVNPFIGYRFALDCLQLELTAGADIATPLKAHEEGEATDHNGNSVKTSLDRTLEITDIRERLQATAYYKKTGLTISYSNGLSNYLTGWVGGTNLAYSRVLRIGLVYKIN
ncbi:hypothetical protein [Adhaeribacter terreus]|uniref:Outer membrane protein beta-barrel domain-containing protein n=1 Tax=Adhaeribacter terreus TaxID=529703 RepID=A0ABW0ED28_9BACT